MKAKVSIITVVWNDISHIEQTIQSVITQTYTNIEYIVIDGGSRDGTWEIIQKYSSNISYSESTPDKGIYDAMNKAVKHASGDWTLFMNSGDTFYSSNTVESIFAYYADSGESIIFGKTNVIDPKLKTETIVDYSYRKQMPAHHQSIFTRTSELRQHPFDLSYRLLADLEFYYWLFNKNPKYKQINIVVANYDNDGLSNNSYGLITKEHFRLALKHNEFKKAIRLLFRITKNKIIRGI